MVPERSPVLAEFFPFDESFQKALLKLLCEDEGFAHAATRYLKPNHFSSEPLSWAYGFLQRHREKYNRSPSIDVILHQTRSLDSRIRLTYELVMQKVREADLKDENWLRDQILDFIKRNIFVQSFGEVKGLFNSGRVTQAYDVMMERMEELFNVTWNPVDESAFFEDLAVRQAKRMQMPSSMGAIPTGFPFLDKVLDGGLSPGELGIWVAYPKAGKSTLLMNLGKNAVAVGMRPTLHFVLEGSRQMVENRYDSAFMDELYGHVKSGDIDSDKYHRAYKQYQVLRGRLVIRGFTDRFDYSVLDLQEAIQDVKRRRGFTPELLIVDYGDLLNGRDFKRGYKSETEKQKAAFRDMKALASRGYAIWTASQAQRPDKDADVKAHWIYARSIADCYEKVRVADFLGSINQTVEEKKAHCLRLLAELYRENEAGAKHVVHADFSRMLIKQVSGTVSPEADKLGMGENPSLGYTPQQAMMPV